MAHESQHILSAYAGRWIAHLWGRVVGQGGTPEQALSAARSSRHKETPRIDYVPTPMPLLFSALLDQIKQAVPQNQRLYLVGGAVRDAVLSIPNFDLDFAVPDNALKLARRIANKLQGAYYRLDDEHETGRVVLRSEQGKRFVFDFARFRGPDLDSDLQGRDFTINAMAVDIHAPQQLLDPLGGLNDLYHKQLRACSAASFVDDPVRILRAVRFAAKYELKMLPETKKLLRAAASHLTQPSTERVRDELFKILDTKRPAASLQALEVLGVLQHILPELQAIKGVAQSPPHVSDVWGHTLHTLQKLDCLLALLAGDHQLEEEGGDLTSGLISLRLGRYRTQLSKHICTALHAERPYRPLLFFAALYHDIGKPATASQEGERIQFIGHENISAEMAVERAKAFNLSNHEIIRLETIIRHHMRPLLLANETQLPSRRTIYRYFRHTGEAGISIALLSLADLMGIYQHTLPQQVLARHLDVLRALLEAYWEQQEEIIAPPALLDGRDLIKTFKLKPGPKIGQLLEAVQEAQAAGDVLNKEDALSLVDNLLKED